MFRLIEKPDSRSSQDNPPSMTFMYKAIGEQNDELMRQMVRMDLPGVVYSADLGQLNRTQVDFQPDGWAQYNVEAKYESPGAGGGGETGVSSLSWSFDTTGATVHLTQAKAHVQGFTSGYPNGVAAPDHKGAIGVTLSGEIEGVDIVIPSLKITATITHEQGVLSFSQARLLAANTGRTNNAPFMGYEAGELLFLGAQGSDGTNTEATVSYQFAASSNEYGTLTFGEINNITKAGHHYAWVEFKTFVSNGVTVTKAIAVQVERVYDSMSFSQILGWQV
jgi:hypothetical protein